MPLEAKASMLASYTGEK